MAPLSDLHPCLPDRLIRGEGEEKGEECVYFDWVREKREECGLADWVDLEPGVYSQDQFVMQSVPSKYS